jgi:hypothetical protein
VVAAETEKRKQARGLEEDAVAADWVPEMVVAAETEK